MSVAHIVTKQLHITLHKYWKCDDPLIKDATNKLIEALDTDLEAVEYGQSDEVGDKLALLESAITEFEESVEGDPEEIIEKKEVEEDEVVDVDDDSELDEDDEEGLESDDEDNNDRTKPA